MKKSLEHTRAHKNSLELSWTHLNSLEIIRTHMNSLIHISHKGKGKGPRAEREKGKPGARHLRCISNLHSPRARTHNTKRFPGYGGACLKANSLPPTSDYQEDSQECSQEYSKEYSQEYTGQTGASTGVLTGILTGLLTRATPGALTGWLNSNSLYLHGF